MAKASAKLAVIVVNYRTPHLAIACLAAAYPQLDDDSAVVVIDNNSGDGSIAVIRGWITANDKAGRVHLIECPENAGFAAGNNLGIRNIKAQFYLLLNSDTVVRPGAIKELIVTAENRLGVGLVSPRLEWPDGTPQQSCFRDHTPISELIAAARTGPITRALKHYDVPMPVSADLLRPEWTSFACVLLRREMLQQIGLLDEAFFMYYEDAELCHRATCAGWEIVHNPAARVVHLRGGSSPVKRLANDHKRLPRYFYESRSRYFTKIYGSAGLFAANLLWTIGRAIAKTREIIVGRPPQVPERQWLDIWINWRPHLRSRDQEKFTDAPA